MTEQSRTLFQKTPGRSRVIPHMRFLAVASIVALHARTVYLYEMEMPYGDRLVQEWFASWVLRVGLPLLSAISGYLIMRGWEPTWSCYRRKMSSRVRSLLVPFVLVSLLTVLGYAVIQQLPGLSSFFDPPLISDWTASQWFDRLFVDPLNYPLYFLRDIFAVALISPLLAWCFARRGFGALVLAALFTCWWLRMDLWIWNIRLLAWFSLGAYATRQNLRWRPALPWVVAATVLWLGLTGYAAWLATETGERGRDLTNGVKLIGVFVFWGWCLRIREGGKWDRFFSPAMAGCFPLFLFHNPIVNFVKEGFMKITGEGPGMPSIAWILAWLAAVLGITLVLNPLGQRWGGKTWQWLTGGRGGG